jgi:hypothetical protein
MIGPEADIQRISFDVPAANADFFVQFLSGISLPTNVTVVRVGEPAEVQTDGFNPDLVTKVFDPLSGENIEVVTIQNLRYFAANRGSGRTVLGTRASNIIRAHRLYKSTGRAPDPGFEDYVYYHPRAHVSGLYPARMPDLAQSLLERKIKVRGVSDATIALIGEYATALVDNRDASL